MRFHLASCIANDRVYAVGGSLRGPGGKPIPFAVMEELDLHQNHWTRKTDMPTARHGLGVSAAGGKVYAIGGWRGVDLPLSRVEEYDPQSNQWRARADMPTARWLLGTCELNGRIYALGGAGPQDPGTFPVALATLEVYDPATDSWSTCAPMPTPRLGLSVSAVGGKLYAIGGLVAAPPRSEQTSITLGTVEEYDPATDTWATKADMPTPRGLFATGAVQGRIYALGGRASSKVNKVDVPLVEEYDPQKDSWASKPVLPEAREGHSCVSVGDRLLIVGGRTRINGLMTSSVIEYNPFAAANPSE